MRDWIIQLQRTRRLTTTTIVEGWGEWKEGVRAETEADNLVLQERGPLPGPETGLLSDTWKWIVQGDTRADKARDFIGKRHLGGEHKRKGTQGGLLCHVARSLRFYGNWVSFRVVSGQSFWLRVLSGGACNRLAKVDSSEEASGRLLGHVDWCLLSPFDLSRILLVGGGLLVLCSLPASPVVK